MPFEMKWQLTRRHLVAGSLAFFGSGRLALATTPTRVVSMDYGLAQTLIEIGLPLVGLVSTEDWPLWAVEPALPAGIVNIGGQTQPNLEQIARLRPDLIVSTPYLETMRVRLETIAPVESFAIHDVGGPPYPHIVEETRRLGDLLGRTREADNLIAQTQSALAEARIRCKPLREAPLVIINFLDTRHIRVYGTGGNIGDTLDALGLKNGWTGETNSWGFATAGYEDLAGVLPGSRLIVMDPVPPDVFPSLSGSPLWQSLPFSRDGGISRMPVVLMFGTLPSMTRLARFLVAIAEGHDISGEIAQP
ncbi:Iron(III)-hydroxamate-binding protein FhuD [Hartmannibacter diazotrophicus]|uniref:Iron(III)-hydroxamate-binding protein FhuD n=1 Tax=Hartmannibacter diazotrophicus TaxID=1482074 RepID=A0A2C9D8P9_9HYPH|nr:iron-siderophore ABC transporter substrate-binding protein [Hartmannibacter diazotrophicus]SON56677.1 Iron(III)-hydroxamate-binding protein FhuD [Hartmannibacter diazotrophicus]